MKRVLHPGLKRGRVVEGAARVLLFGLLVVLVASVVHGVATLP